MDKAEARQALGERVKARRLELGLSQRAVAQAAQLAHLTVRRIEAGDRVRDLSLEAISIALGWPQGHALKLLHNSETAPAPEPEPVHALVAPAPALPHEHDVSNMSLRDLLALSEAITRELRRRFT